jgi:glycosyltransferase involved in cell wall biosynthesis
MKLGNGPVIGFVGRIRREKGLDILIDSFSHILQAHPDAVLVVVGDGPDGENLRRKVEDLKLGDHVKWLGQKSPEEVYQFYSIMDVVAVPSLFEGFGLSAAEAMAAGRPVVASSVDGLNEIVEKDVTGYLVPADDKSAFTARLTELLCNPGTKKSEEILLVRCICQCNLCSL